MNLQFYVFHVICEKTQVFAFSLEFILICIGIWCVEKVRCKTISFIAFIRLFYTHIPLILLPYFFFGGPKLYQSSK